MTDEGTKKPRKPIPLAQKFELEGKKFKPPKKGVFTDRWIDRCLPPLKEGYVTYDAKTTGLGIQVPPTGRKVWILQATFPGQQYQARRKLGTYPQIGLKDARLKAAEWLKLIERDIDPEDAAREKVEAAAEERRKKALQNKQTFGAFAEEYIASRNNRRATPDAREIRRMLISAWGTRPIHEISPRDVRELFAKLKAKAPYDAKNAWLHASGIFKAAVFQDLIAVSPLASVDRKQLFPKGTIKPRQRALTDEELRAFWTGTEKFSKPYEQFFKLLLLTGVRVNELAQARWSELDPALRKALRDARAGKPVNWQTLPDEAKTLTVPRERFKSDRTHVVQLSHSALDVIGRLPRGDFLFSTTAGKKPINGLSKAKARLDQYMLEYLREEAAARGEDPAQVKLQAWVNHDIRRVLRTGLAALGIRFEVAENILGHTLGGLHATYNVHSYGPEQREALEKWAARLRTIVTPQPPAPTAATAANVVNMPQRKRRVS